MSLVTCNPVNQLPDDVLLVIFDQLDDEALLRCETVCRQWRNVLLSGRPWKRLFHRQMVSSQLWRRVLQNFEVDVDELETVRYRGLCRAIMQQLNEIYRNWRTGNFEEEKSLYDFTIVTVANDCVVSISNRERHSLEKTLRFFDRRSKEFTGSTKIPLEWLFVTNTKIVVLWDQKTIKVVDINGQLISEIPELDEDELISWKLGSICLSGDEIAVISRTKGQEKLSLWDVSDPLKVTLLNSQFSNFGLKFPYDFSMNMDEEFIFISFAHTETTRFYFFSKETLDLHWQKTVDGCMKDNFIFGMGFFLLYFSNNEKSEEHGVIQVHDVESRKCFHEICIEFKCNLQEVRHKVDFNSKFMAVAQMNEYQLQCVNIYDLEAMKNPKSSADDLLVHSVTVQFDFDVIVVTETEIFCEEKQIRILDFGSFECFRNEAKSLTLSLPWRDVWRSKGVDEEHLQPAHHMEVYREVLQYFHQLSMNCQKAIQKHRVATADPATFTLGEDFIGYGPRIPKMVIYDEKMKKRNRKMRYQTVQISKSKYISVMGKTVQLIHSKKGYVISEMKLKKEAIGLHFSHNRLVFVGKMAENEHLLSVWKVENNVDLTHVKDVAIGKYFLSKYEEPLQVDEHFIAVYTPIGDDDVTINLISMKTFQVERSLSCLYFGSYDGGYVFLMNSDHSSVRMLDVTSGTFLHDMRMKLSYFDVILTRVNSNYVVIVTTNRVYSTLHVYDLKCLKETDAVPTHLLLTKIDLKFTVKRMLMNETRIVCLSHKNMYVLEFEPIDRLRCPESC
jgi:WD40 repeat protein